MWSEEGGLPYPNYVKDIPVFPTRATYVCDTRKEILESPVDLFTQTLGLPGHTFRTETLKDGYNGMCSVR